MLVEKLSQKDFELVATVCRNIWGQRNKVVFENNFESPRVLLRLSLKQIEEFQSSNQDPLG